VRILFGSDGSRYALAAARFLAQWVPGKGKRVDLVAVAPAVRPSTRRSYRKPKPVDELWKGAVGRWVADTARPLESTGYRVEPVITSHTSAASYLVGRSREEAYDLVVVGGRGRSEEPFFDVGSVARSVLEHAPTSVLLMRERTSSDRGKQAPRKLRPFRVLLPTDGEQHSLQAIRQMLALLAIADLEVRVVSTLEGEELDALEHLPPSARRERRDAAEKAARLRLNQAANHLEPHLPSVETAFLEGPPEEAVVEDARDWQADLLVLGSRGSMDEEGSRKRRSTALAIARSAPCSVLLIREG
jgi:nucleotide-binding universal stress UspA family protein